MGERFEILQGDVRERLRELPGGLVQCVVTSPPYWAIRTFRTEPQVWGGLAGCEHVWASVRTPMPNLSGGMSSEENPFAAKLATKGADNYSQSVDYYDRAYYSDTCRKCMAWRGELGQEPDVQMYVRNIVRVCREIRRVLRHDGTFWLNLGDTFGGGKQLLGIPWRVALALQEDGWVLRSEVTWCKKSPMPSSAKDRPTLATEKMFLFAKNERYYYDQDAAREPAAVSTGRRMAKGVSDKHKNVNGAPGQTPHTMNKPREHAGGPVDGPLTRNMWNYLIGVGYQEDLLQEVLERIEAERLQAESGGGEELRDFWLLGPDPQREAHFATFPRELVRRCVLLGTSERGCCSECGAPYGRVVEISGGSIGRSWHEFTPAERSTLGQQVTDRAAKGGHGYQRVHQGWRHTCPHRDAPIEPCVVLDPFCGSGRAGMVAVQYGRRFIGIELQPEYVEMAERLIGAVAAHTAHLTGEQQESRIEA